MKEGKQFYEKNVVKIALSVTKLLEYLNSFSLMTQQLSYREL